MYQTNTPTAPASSGVSGRGVLEGAFTLLEALRKADDTTLTTLAAACGLPKSTAHRLLDQLADLGAVERRAGRYLIGPRMFQLGHGWQPFPALRPAARQPARRLAAVTGATVGLAVLHQGHTLFLDWTAPPDRPPPPVSDRSTWPWYTAAGKVLVAGGAPGLPPGPLPDAWRVEAAAIRARGAAYDREGVLEGMCCAAVPVYARGDTPVASLCVLTDPEHHLERLADTARRTATAIGAALRRRR